MVGCSSSAPLIKVMRQRGAGGAFELADLAVQGGALDACGPGREGLHRLKLAGEETEEVGAARLRSSTRMCSGRGVAIWRLTLAGFAGGQPAPVMQ